MFLRVCVCVWDRFRTEARAAGYSKSHLITREEREEAELADMKKVTRWLVCGVVLSSPLVVLTSSRYIYPVYTE